MPLDFKGVSRQFVTDAVAVVSGRLNTPIAGNRQVPYWDSPAGEIRWQNPMTFDPRTYGASFDGSGDGDFDGIQAAIDAAVAAAGATGRAIVSMPAGVAVLDKEGGGGLRIPPGTNGLTIEGAGKGATVLRLSKEVLRAFDWWQGAVTAPVFQNVTLRKFTVDAYDIGGDDVGPDTTISGGYTLTQNQWVTVNVGSNAAWASKGLVFFPSSNSGTSKGKKYLFRKTASSSTSIDILNYNSGTTIVSGDHVVGAVNDHVVVGTMMSGNNIAAWNHRYDNITVEDIEAKNIPTVITSGLGTQTENFRGAVWFQPVCDPANPPATPMYATRIYVRRCEAWGGECGFAVGTYGSAPAAYSMFLDDIVFEDLKHSAMVKPTSNYTGENFIIGGSSYGYRCRITRCWGEYSGDVGLELDAMLDAVVEDTTIEDAAGGNFYSTNYNVPCRTIDGPPKTTVAGGGITSGDTTLTVPSVPAGVARAGYAMIENELVYYVQSSATSLSITRGRGTASAASHAAGVAVIFFESHRQRFKFRRCVSRHTRVGIESNNYMPKGWYQFQGPRPQPPIEITECEYENTTPEIGDTATFGAEAISISGENPHVYVDGLVINRHGFSHTALDGRLGALIDFYRANPGSEPAQIELKNVKFRVTGELASGTNAPKFAAITFRSGIYVIDWDSLSFDFFLANAGPGLTYAIDSGTNLSTINGLIRRSRYRSRQGDAAPIFLNIAPTSGATINYLSLRDTDLRSLSFSPSAGNPNYRPFYIDNTQTPYVTIEGTKHATNAEASAYARNILPERRVTADYVAQVWDEYIGVASTTAPRQITLPPITHSTSSPGFKMMQGRKVTVKDESNGAGTNAITIIPSGSETIDFLSSRTINTNGGAMTFRATSVGWVVESVR
jgi:hypothetical protein